MANIQIGRIGLEAEKLDLIERARHTAGRGGIPVYEFQGVIVTPTLANAKYLRNQLLAQFDLYSGDVWSAVPILWAADDTMDGYYRLISVQIGTEKIHPGSVKMPFTVTTERLGGNSQVMLQSLLTINDIVSDHGTVGKPWHSPAAGAEAYSTGGAFPDVHERTTEEGDLKVAVDLPQDVVDPTWSTEPENYYLGCSRIHVDGKLIAGLECEMLPTSWVMGNGLLEIRAAVFEGASNGNLQVRLYDGATWGAWINYEIVWDNSVVVPAWNYFTVIDNRPEVCTVRLMRDAAEDSPTTSLHTLDLTLRRGATYVAGRYNWDGGLTTSALQCADGGTWTRPGGDASYAYATIGGVQTLMGIPKDYTLSGAKLAVNVDAATMPFFIGAALGANGSGDGPVDIAQQYIGWTSEVVQGIRR